MSDGLIIAAITRLETGVATVLQDLRTIREEQAAMRDEQSSMREEQTSMREEQTAMREEQTAMREEQTSMREEQRSMRHELTALRKDVTALQQGQMVLQQGQTALRVDLMERMDRLQDSISACRDDIGVNMARADRAHDVNENTREELRSLSKEVSMMWRQLKQLESKVRGITGEP